MHFSPRFFAFRLALLLTGGVFLLNCGGGATSHLTSLTVTPPDVEAVAPAGTAQFNATGSFDHAPTGSTSVAPHWESSDSSVVNITNTGLATCLAAGGPVTITASAPGASGSIHGSATLTCLASMPTGIGKCIADGVNSLSGYCVGTRGGVCREAYDPVNCPPQTPANGPQADQCAQSSFNVDSTRSCTP